MFRPLPPLPDLDISEESVGKLAEVVQKGANCALSIAHEITIGQNLKVVLQVSGDRLFKIFLFEVTSAYFSIACNVKVADVLFHLQVACGLWIVSCIGSLVNFLTLAYIGKSISALPYFSFLFNYFLQRRV